MGVTYAISCDKNAGVDVDAIQKHYLWTTGAKMLGFALLMVMAAVVVGYCASRVGASIGRDLRDKTFRNVVQYSNAEMDHFSTASLITRSTNDVQQIQMVTAVFLRMILYAPIIGIGGVSFSDFICTLAMPCYDFRLFSNCNTKISEKSDTAKSWATFCCSGTYK